MRERRRGSSSLKYAITLDWTTDTRDLAIGFWSRCGESDTDSPIEVTSVGGQAQGRHRTFSTETGPSLAGFEIATETEDASWQPIGRSTTSIRRDMRWRPSRIGGVRTEEGYSETRDGLAAKRWRRDNSAWGGVLAGPLQWPRLITANGAQASQLHAHSLAASPDASPACLHVSSMGPLQERTSIPLLEGFQRQRYC